MRFWSFLVRKIVVSLLGISAPLSWFYNFNRFSIFRYWIGSSIVSQFLPFLPNVSLVLTIVSVLQGFLSQRNSSTLNFSLLSLASIGSYGLFYILPGSVLDNILSVLLTPIFVVSASYSFVKLIFFIDFKLLDTFGAESTGFKTYASTLTGIAFSSLCFLLFGNFIDPSFALEVKLCIVGVILLSVFLVIRKEEGSISQCGLLAVASTCFVSSYAIPDKSVSLSFEIICVILFILSLPIDVEERGSWFVENAGMEWWEKSLTIIAISNLILHRMNLLSTSFIFTDKYVGVTFVLAMFLWFVLKTMQMMTKSSSEELYR